ncbi:hypothetical protein RFI_05369 [Reticulomyxa filosa]|uniref:Uncharacterized protein n=1 Tax=Reticulomyxa filosa TaxID=46433 RepID=X6P0U0_RETFI|nr:hypothetical protein RFI_05369 [Reticulomyxa filosa]|eukprot:ETO31748.1 hypothetical protein RFI_05369 [Reticulomyxa filosa]
MDTLIEEFQSISPPDVTALYYRYANEIVNTVLLQRKSIAKYCDMYGVTLSGCVQKQLAIPHLSCGYLVFLYYLKEKQLRDNFKSLQTKHKNILKQIQKCVKNETTTKNEIKILRHSKPPLRIKWKGFEYHIVIAWTFWKRQYCSFHYTQNNVHVYPFSPEQLQIAANDLIEEASIHQRYIRKMGRAHGQLKSFFGKKYVCFTVIASSILYERRIGWKEHPISNIVFEIMATRYNESSIAPFKQFFGANTPISVFDIIRQFFELIMQIKRSTDRTWVIDWPYRRSKFQCLVSAHDIDYYKRQPKHGDILKRKDLFDVDEDALNHINDNLFMQSVDLIFASFSFFFVIALLLDPFPK